MHDDQDILDLLASRNDFSAPFNLLFSRYQKKVYWNVRRMVIDHDDANDVTQNIFIKIWNGLESFKGESKLSSWIFRITINETLNFIRSKKLKATFSFHDYEEVLSNKLSDNTVFNGSDIERNLQKALLKLPPKQRQVFNLRYYDNMPYEEMSVALDTSVGALKASYHHASTKVELFLKSL
jgi:RNA polymerase sigma-70 factor (ECF subfamily)